MATGEPWGTERAGSAMWTLVDQTRRPGPIRMTQANGMPISTPRIVGSPTAMATIDPAVQPIANQSTVARLRLFMPAPCASLRWATTVRAYYLSSLKFSQLHRSVLLCMEHRKVVPVRSM